MSAATNAGGFQPFHFLKTVVPGSLLAGVVAQATQVVGFDKDLGNLPLFVKGEERDFNLFEI